MSKRKIFNIVALVLLVILFIDMFLDLTTSGVTVWGSYDEMIMMQVILVIELLSGIVLCALQVFGIIKDSKFAVFPLGFFLTDFLSSLIYLIDNDAISYAGVGLWIGLITSIAALVFIIVANLMSNEVKPKPMYNGYGQNMGGYNPNNGMPMYKMNQPMNQQQGGYYPNNGNSFYR